MDTKSLEFFKLADNSINVSLTSKDITKVADVKKMAVNSTDGAYEKHVPVVEIDGDTVHVKVGSVEHPMLENHWIEFILVETCCGFHVKHLGPGLKPEASFKLKDEKVLRVYEHCNLHGLYVYEVK